MAANPRRFALPRPLKGRPGCDFSFSGLKTAVRQHRRRARPARAAATADLAAAVELAICDALVDRTANAIAWFRRHHPGGHEPVAAGGVAANSRLRRRLAALAEDARVCALSRRRRRLCTDNGAMIAWAGIERLRLGLVDGLDAAPRPRWPLDAGAPSRPGAGSRG